MVIVAASVCSFLLLSEPAFANKLAEDLDAALNESEKARLSELPSRASFFADAAKAGYALLPEGSARRKKFQALGKKLGPLTDAYDLVDGIYGMSTGKSIRAVAEENILRIRRQHLNSVLNTIEASDPSIQLQGVLSAQQAAQLANKLQILARRDNVSDDEARSLRDFASAYMASGIDLAAREHSETRVSLRQVAADNVALNKKSRKMAGELEEVSNALDEIRMFVDEAPLPPATFAAMSHAQRMAKMRECEDSPRICSKLGPADTNYLRRLNRVVKAAENVNSALDTYGRGAMSIADNLGVNIPPEIRKAVDIGSAGTALVSAVLTGEPTAIVGAIVGVTGLLRKPSLSPEMQSLQRIESSLLRIEGRLEEIDRKLDDILQGQVKILGKLDVLHAEIESVKHLLELATRRQTQYSIDTILNQCAQSGLTFEAGGTFSALVPSSGAVSSVTDTRLRDACFSGLAGLLGPRRIEGIWGDGGFDLASEVSRLHSVSLLYATLYGPDAEAVLYYSLTVGGSWSEVQFRLGQASTLGDAIDEVAARRTARPRFLKDEYQLVPMSLDRLMEAIGFSSAYNDQPGANIRMRSAARYLRSYAASRIACSDDGIAAAVGLALANDSSDSEKILALARRAAMDPSTLDTRIAKFRIAALLMLKATSTPDTFEVGPHERYRLLLETADGALRRFGDPTSSGLVAQLVGPALRVHRSVKGAPVVGLKSLPSPDANDIELVELQRLLTSSPFDAPDLAFALDWASRIGAYVSSLR